MASRPVASVTRRLVLTIAGILIAGAVLIALAAGEYGRRAADEAYDRLLVGAAFQISERVLGRDGRVLVDLPSSAFQLLALAREDRVFYRVVAPDGSTVTGYEGLPLPDGAAAAGHDLYDTRFAGADVRAVAVRRHLAERSIRGTALVVVAHTMQARSALAGDITEKALLLIAAAGIVTLTLVLVAVRLSLRPLARVESALRARDPKNLAPLDVEPPRELATVVGAIDHFMGRLRNRVEGIERFIADAAHQLRTPITAIRAQADLARGEQDPGRLRALCDRIHQRAVGMSRLADQLLSHALVIHRAEATPLVAVDLRRVAAEAARDVDLNRADGDQTVRLDLPEEPVVALADEVSLGEAVKNIVNNALRYGRPPVVIAAVVSADGRRACLAVTDAGDGLPESAWADAGRRFSRDRPPRGEGAGLGLSIVRAVAEAHSGALVFCRPDARGFRVSVELPAAAGEVR